MGGGEIGRTNMLRQRKKEEKKNGRRRSEGREDNGERRRGASQVLKEGHARLEVRRPQITHVIGKYEGYLGLLGRSRHACRKQGTDGRLGPYLCHRLRLPASSFHPPCAGYSLYGGK
jgi:hypothetical protein